MTSIVNTLSRIEQEIYLYSYSVLDKLFLKQSSPNVLVCTTATLIDLAKTFPTIDFPGLDDFDASIGCGNSTIYFRTIDSKEELPPHRVLPLSFMYDIHRAVFIDRYEAYASLRKPMIYLSSNFGYPFTWEEIGEIAVLLSRYHYTLPDDMATIGEPEYPLPVDKQRIILSQIVTGKNAERGLRFLHDSGFIAVHWPELTELNNIEHSKEYHPEGNVWEHTLAALSQRKSLDLPLGLGLLLHDIGKLDSERYEGNQFHQHAQIGSISAVQFMQNLHFSNDVINAVRYLVKYHMLPAAIGKLPLYKIEHIISSPYFPSLLELFRCDLASSYRDLSKYYTACREYKRYVKDQKNPFKDTAYRHSLLPKSI